MDIHTTPHFEKSALIIIDFQNDCVLPGGTFEIPGSFEIMPKVEQLVKTMRKMKRPIVHVVRAYLPDGSNADLCRRTSFKSGQSVFNPFTGGADFPENLKPEAAPSLDWNGLLAGQIQQIGTCDWVVYKSRWGAFYKTSLEDFLHEKDVDTLIFAGCNFPNCPRTSIYEASERDFRIVLVKDAISGLYDRGLTEMDRIGVCVMETEEILSLFL